MIVADEYAPPSAVIGVVVIGALLILLGAALYRYPGIGWSMARFRMSRARIAEERRVRQASTEKSFRVLAVALILGGVVVIGIAIKSGFS